FETNESIYVVNRDRFVTGDIDGMLFEKQRSKEVMSPNDDDAPTYEITDRQMFHYDLPSKELAELKYPKEIPVDAEMDWRNKDMLYFTKLIDDELHVLGYSRESKRNDFEQMFACLKRKNAQKEPLIQIKNDRVYIVSTNNHTKVTLFVRDLTSGHTVYEGLIEVNHKQNIPDNDTIELHDFEIHD